MEIEILQTLQEIRGILYALTAIVSLVMLVWMANWISNIIANFKKALENDFINRADKYYKSAEFDKLAEHCQEKLAKYPNHSNATWWLARAKLETGSSSEARKLFKRLLELEPNWKETHIEPYLDKLPID
ncbi:MAG: tetratricopeptide repeat protein [Candidatus Thiodiazotropha sp. (ex. Lucinisca nassula)]|nr:tetratricopeptide repeat protein [Candidatus Thiodiazotropha sp. (ex. Lucinisca nassula)]